MATTVTKDPKYVERGKRAYETHLRKIKESILSSSSTGTTISSTPSCTTATLSSTPSSTTATHIATTTIPITTIPITTIPITTTSFTLLGTGAVAVIIFAGYYYINRKPAPAKPAEQPPPQKDAAFFKMQ